MLWDMSRFGSPPASDLDVRPTQDDVDFFEENGFLVVPQITTQDELDWLTEIALAVLDDNAGTPVFEPGYEKGQELPPQIQQSIGPELLIPELLETTFRRNAMLFAAALLGEPEEKLTTWGHVLRKPAGSNRPAPWHQDQAYWQPELDYHALGSWLPLHEVSVERGCMQFIPGSHKGPLLHHGFSGDPAGNLLIVDDIEDAKAVPCPLPAGGATFHHHLTLHYTAPNTTDLDRIAFPMEFQVLPWRREVPVHTPWVDTHREAIGAPVGGPLTALADGKIVAIP
jgi:hypothetical protein